MSQSKMEWSGEDVLKVIKLYRKFPCLWDLRSPLYKRHDLKRNGWHEIAKKMGKDEEEVRKKIKHLRSAYVSEKKKVDDCRKSGTDAEEVYCPHLFYYDELNFLNSAVVLRKTASNLEKEESPPPQKSLKRHRSERDDKFNSAIDAFVRQADMSCSLMSVTKEEETMYTAFGKSIGFQLSQLSVVSAAEAMAEIQSIVSNKTLEDSAML